MGLIEVKLFMRAFNPLFIEFKIREIEPTEVALTFNPLFIERGVIGVLDAIQYVNFQSSFH